MTPTQFLARLSALVPPPRHPLVRFYGVWAPHHRWRSSVVTATLKTKQPSASEPSSPCGAPPGAKAAQCETSRTHSSTRAASAAATPRAEAALPTSSLESSDALRFARLSRLAWAVLYQRVFDIDPLECSSCGGRMRFIDGIKDIGRARSELRRRNLPAEPPPLARARAPDWDS